MLPVAIKGSPCFWYKKSAKQVPIAMAKCCPHCGKHFAEMPAREDAESVTSGGFARTVVHRWCRHCTCRIYLEIEMQEGMEGL